MMGFKEEQETQVHDVRISVSEQWWDLKQNINSGRIGHIWALANNDGI